MPQKVSVGDVLLRGKVKFYYSNETPKVIYRETGRRYETKDGMSYEIELASPRRDSNLCARFYIIPNKGDNVFDSAMSVLYSNVIPELNRVTKIEIIEENKTPDPLKRTIKDITEGFYDENGLYAQQHRVKKPTWSSRDLSTYRNYMRIVNELIGDKPIDYLYERKNQVDFMRSITTMKVIKNQNRKKNVNTSPNKKRKRKTEEAPEANAEGSPMARKTIKNFLSAFSNCYSYLVRIDNVSIKNPIPEMQRNLLPDEEENENTRMPIPKELVVKIFTSPEWECNYISFALSFMALTTSLRASELLGLQVKDVDFVKRTIRVNKSWDRHECKFKTTKTGTSRTSVLSSFTEKLIVPLIKGKKANDLIFMAPKESLNADRYYKYITNGFIRVLRTYEKSPQLVFHSLRHSWFTYMTEQGITDDIKSLIGGHDSFTKRPSQMNAHYTKISTKTVENVGKVLDEMFTEEELKEILQVFNQIKKDSKIE